MQFNGTSTHRPPYIWEAPGTIGKAGVKEHRVNDETLLTFMAEVESLLNSRTLNHLSDDFRDEKTLTPNLFILGRASPNLPLAVAL